MGFKQVKCVNCGQWTDGNLQQCTHCDHDHLAAYNTDREERLAVEDWEFEWLIVKEDDFWLLKILKYTLRGGQLIFFFIVSIFASIMSSAAH